MTAIPNSAVLTERIQAANAAGRPALAPFLPAGYPDKERFFGELDQLDQAGADIIEVGMPFSDPVADGPVVEKASLHSLELGVNLAWILAELAKHSYHAGLVLMGYLNPIMQYGYDRFAADAAKAGVAGVIVADLPYEESADLRLALEKKGLCLIPLVGLNTSRERMGLYARHAKGFAYFVSVLGTTGERSGVSDEVRAQITLAREVFDVPVALGFGLKSKDQLQELEGLVDAAVFGSALIRHIDQGGSSSEFMARWK